MPRSTRMFEIIQILRSADGPLTAEAIAGQLEVTKRTVYRDIAALQGMRVPIEGEAGIGYVMGRGFDLPPLMFSAEEVEAIAVGLALLRRTGDSGLERAARRVSEKIADVLPDEAGSPVPLHVSGWNRIPASATSLADLRRAIRDEDVLHLRYLDLSDVRTERNIRPIALLYYVDALILAGWCELRQAFRHFRIDRIESSTPTGNRFTGQGKSLRERWLQEHEMP